MKQIYTFDCFQPPDLNEKKLWAEIQRRATLRQTALLALAGILAELCLIVTALLVRPVNEVLAFAIIAYVCVSISGCAIIAIVYDLRRRNLICTEH